MTFKRIGRSLAMAGLLSFVVGFLGVGGLVVPTVSAQTMFTIVSPPPEDSYEDNGVNEYLYYMGANYNCTPGGSHRTTTSHLDATAAHATFVLPAGCGSVRTRLLVVLCHPPQPGTQVTSNVTRANGQSETMQLQPIAPGSQQFELEVFSAPSDAPVVFDTATSPLQFIEGVELDYACWEPQCEPTGEWVRYGEGVAESCVQSLVAPLHPGFPASSCSGDRGWSLSVRVTTTPCNLIPYNAKVWAKLGDVNAAPWTFIGQVNDMDVWETFPCFDAGTPMPSAVMVDGVPWPRGFRGIQWNVKCCHCP